EQRTHHPGTAPQKQVPPMMAIAPRWLRIAVYITSPAWWTYLVFLALGFLACIAYMCWVLLTDDGNDTYE
ncbi:MAG TPA: hypothetical protein PL070_08760, partial [Flavobacteriales bacterium]|nr:hypothetical protein [Flavobacteriales bacterium]